MARALDLLTFDEALNRSPEGKRKVLLGNGFSIAWKPAVFQYRALLDAADFSQLSVDGRQLFDILGTADFEEVIQRLKAAAAILPLYVDDPNARERALRDADRLKDALAEVLARRHPEHPGEVSDDEYASAARFLGHFKRIFTMNYDLLLYWVVMHDSPTRALRDDGFRSDPEDPEAEYVTWDTTPVSESQSVYYLHGAMHLFDSGTKLEKFTWNRTGVRLIEQVRSALRGNLFPLVVTEGASDEKLAKILHSAYLNHARRSFARIADSLFIFGHSLAENDGHILNLISEGKLSQVFVSLRGDPATTDNRRLIARARALVARRRSGRPLALQFFDADSASVWR